MARPCQKRSIHGGRRGCLFRSRHIDRAVRNRAYLGSPGRRRQDASYDESGLGARPIGTR